MRTLPIYFLILVLFIAACGGNESDSMSEEKSVDQLKQEAIASIKEQEASLYNAPSDKIDVDRAEKMINLYIQFANNNGDDENTPEFLLSAADLCVGIKAYDRALNILKNFDRDYRGHKKAPAALFLSGFIYDNYLDKKGMAETQYSELIKRYPRHDLAIQAQASIQNLHLTDEEMIRKFEEMNAVEKPEG